MPVGMAGRFVPTRHNLAHESRIALGDPAENEKRAAGAADIQKVHEPPRVLFDAAGVLSPRLARNNARECLDVEVVFDVDGDNVAARHVVAAVLVEALYPGRAWRLRTATSNPRTFPAAAVPCPAAAWPPARAPATMCGGAALKPRSAP